MKRRPARWMVVCYSESHLPPTAPFIGDSVSILRILAAPARNSYLSAIFAWDSLTMMRVSQSPSIITRSNKGIFRPPCLRLTGYGKIPYTWLNER